MEQYFGKYLVKKELGRGAMGIVYLAYDESLDRDVAVKTIASSIKETNLRERFIREARAAGKLRHNNIVTIFDFGTEGDQLYTAMEYLEGEDLYEFILDKRYMEILDKLEIIRQICLGLDFAHNKGVFHRDIKPANIRLLPDGSIKIVDFGLAVIQSSSLTRTGSVLGTPMYTSPERLQGLASDGRADQFAVGILLFELLTFERAFHGENISSIIYHILNGEPRSLEARIVFKFPELEQIIRRSIMKSPDHRYPSMKHMADEIEKLQLKMKNDSFSMTGPIGLIEESVNDTEAMDSSVIAKQHKKSPIPVVLPIAAIIIIALAVYFLFLKETPPGPTTEPGYLALDVKPYAIIGNIINLDTGERVPLKNKNEATPLKLMLRPGKYEIEYSSPHPQWGGARKQTVTITAGDTVHAKDCMNERFVKEAIEHFSVKEDSD
ncbi:MAG: serine/threonine protein kinase [bacterium]|nr:serine/threonine protein kinase [bacterium]